MDPATRRVGALLAPLTNYERQRPDAPRWTLDTMRRLLARPGAPRRPPLLVQIGGSKGKGTTGAYLESLARQGGLRTGLYTSPHVESILERVRLDGRDVDEELLVAELRPILDFAAAQRLEVSFFEVMTAAALGCFARHGVELGILEVGLGGRLDATTAVEVDASIVTGIELEHQDLLGDTLCAIAAEKAFVLRAGRPGFVAAGPPALGVLAGHAERVGCALRVLGADFDFDLATDEPAWDVSTPCGARHRVAVPGAPLHEGRALALAVACLEALRPDLPLPSVLLRPDLPGRFETVPWPDGHPFVLDGAHTEQSVEVLGRELVRRFHGARPAVLFASARGKRWRQALSHLLPIADSFLVTGLSGTAPEDPETIRGWLVQQGARARAVSDAATGLHELDAFAGVRVVTGSFYLVGEVRRLLLVRP